jgi:hypothetical protein
MREAGMGEMVSVSRDSRDVGLKSVSQGGEGVVGARGMGGSLVISEEGEKKRASMGRMEERGGMDRREERGEKCREMRLLMDGTPSVRRRARGRVKRNDSSAAADRDQRRS